jgi:hypothetical protein
VSSLFREAAERLRKNPEVPSGFTASLRFWHALSTSPSSLRVSAETMAGLIRAGTRNGIALMSMWGYENRVAWQCVLVNERLKVRLVFVDFFDALSLLIDGVGKNIRDFLIG